MAIFNSLGSNYNFGFVLRSLFAVGNGKDRLKLIKFLEKKYCGQVFLTYKGREALRLALRIIGKQKEYAVGICGFTCYAVYEAVKKEGYQLCFNDLNHDNINFSYETFKKNFLDIPKMKIIIVQNTLGHPCEIEKIAKFCQEKGIILIEDLAHSIGAKYEDGREAGTVGGFTVLSFSQDKMVDGISGGALVLRDKNFQFPISNFQFQKLNKRQQLRDRIYPLFTFLIRKTYGIGLGELLHAILKKFNLLSKPMEGMREDFIYGLPDWYCGLIYHKFKYLERDLIHRRRIASIYADELNKKIVFKNLVGLTTMSANLRFPIFVENRGHLIEFLKMRDIFVSDIWYDAPIAPKKYLHMTDYKNQCPNAEKISREILNLPTHRNVGEREAGFIAEKVNEWISIRHSRAGGNL